jgi:hypothetical protein
LVSLPSFCGRLARPNGQSTAKIAAAVISANTNHSVIKRASSSGFRLSGANSGSADTPLYTTGGKRGN